MQWDLGLQGLGLLLVMSLIFAVIAQLVVGRRTTPWMWLIAGATYFVAGIAVSEVLYGWATVEELQPNIDGLSFDEVLLFGTAIATLAVGTIWFLRRGERRARTA